MQNYGVGLNRIIALLDPRVKAKPFSSVPLQRKARATKLCKNSNTGEVLETKGGNHKVLNAWKSGFGPDVVESWLK